jgi:hypothetical protein
MVGLDIQYKDATGELVTVWSTLSELPTEPQPATDANRFGNSECLLKCATDTFEARAQSTAWRKWRDLTDDAITGLDAPNAIATPTSNADAGALHAVPVAVQAAGAGEALAADAEPAQAENILDGRHYPHFSMFIFRKVDGKMFSLGHYVLDDILDFDCDPEDTNSYQLLKKMAVYRGFEVADAPEEESLSEQLASFSSRLSMGPDCPGPEGIPRGNLEWFDTAGCWEPYGRCASWGTPVNLFYNDLPSAANDRTKGLSFRVDIEGWQSFAMMSESSTAGGLQLLTMVESVNISLGGQRYEVINEWNGPHKYATTVSEMLAVSENAAGLWF